MPFSFVSKLVAIHVESSPIYDRHVASFFGASAPSAAVPKADRINWYINFLAEVRSSYIAWADDREVREVLVHFVQRDTRLAKCHVVRQLDFLVWKVGNKKLLHPR
jgi:hypothetical protein